LVNININANTNRPAPAAPNRAPAKWLKIFLI
jgi:hypothetical protein